MLLSKSKDISSDQEEMRTIGGKSFQGVSVCSENRENSVPKIVKDIVLLQLDSVCVRMTQW